MALTLTGCVTASGAASGGGFKTFTRHNLTPSEKELVVSSVKGSLKDPASATFGEIKAGVTGKGFIAVCGFVNARNSFGGA